MNHRTGTYPVADKWHWYSSFLPARVLPGVPQLILFTLKALPCVLGYPCCLCLLGVKFFPACLCFLGLKFFPAYYPCCLCLLGVKFFPACYPCCLCLLGVKVLSCFLCLLGVNFFPACYPCFLYLLGVKVLHCLPPLLLVFTWGKSSSLPATPIACIHLG